MHMCICMCERGVLCIRMRAYAPAPCACFMKARFKSRATRRSSDNEAQFQKCGRVRAERRVQEYCQAACAGHMEGLAPALKDGVPFGGSEA